MSLKKYKSMDLYATNTSERSLMECFEAVAQRKSNCRGVPPMLVAVIQCGKEYGRHEFVMTMMTLILVATMQAMKQHA
tara:strand:- start:93 stop:326 length:234 start_codon:yes stop_codon:yes gene_type:complete